jgi:hypothetical protein
MPKKRAMPKLKAMTIEEYLIVCFLVGQTTFFISETAPLKYSVIEVINFIFLLFKV